MLSIVVVFIIIVVLLVLLALLLLPLPFCLTLPTVSLLNCNRCIRPCQGRVARRDSLSNLAEVACRDARDVSKPLSGGQVAFLLRAG